MKMKLVGRGHKDQDVGDEIHQNYILTSVWLGGHLGSKNYNIEGFKEDVRIKGNNLTFRAKQNKENSVINFNVRCHTTDRKKLRVFRQNQLSDR